MNIHPILVHFPIALLTIYAIMEVLRFTKLQGMMGWWYAKAYLAVVGAVAVCAAFASGDETGGCSVLDPATHAKVFELHQTWAAVTVTIFVVIGFHYLIELLRRNPSVIRFTEKSHLTQQIWNILSRLSRFIGTPIVLVVLALAGLCAITITGGLGGSIVYGPDVDPVVSFIYRFLVN